MRSFQRDLRADHSRGPVGRPHIYLNPIEGSASKGISLSAADLNAAVLHTLDWLIDEQQVEPSDIAVVTCLGRQTSIWARSDQRRIGARYELHWVAPGDHRATQDRQPIALATMRTCKGREWPIVILVELEGLKRLKNRRPGWSYIATSRAKHQLIVIGDPHDLMLDSELQVTPT
jgi:hypothetical protein